MVEYSKIEDIEKEMLMTLNEAFSKFTLPIVIHKDRWVLNNLKFVITKVAKTDDGVRVFGNFIYDNLRETGLKELQHPNGKFRVSPYDASKYVEGLL